MSLATACSAPSGPWWTLHSSQRAEPSFARTRLTTSGGESSPASAGSAPASVVGRSSSTTSSSTERPISSSGAHPSVRSQAALASRKRPSGEKTASRSFDSRQNCDMRDSASAARTTARSRSTVAISTLATDSTNPRSSSENAARRRLQTTSSPNAVSPLPTGAETRLTNPSAARPGERKLVSVSRSGVSSVLPASRRRTTDSRSSGEGSGGRGGGSPALARTMISPSAVVSTTMTTSLASVSCSTRAASSSRSATGLPRSASEPRPLTRACCVRRCRICSLTRTRSVMSWATITAPSGRSAGPAGAKWSQNTLRPSTDSKSSVRDAPASAASQCSPRRAQAAAGITSRRSRPIAAAGSCPWRSYAAPCITTTRWSGSTTITAASGIRPSTMSARGAASLRLSKPINPGVMVRYYPVRRAESSSAAITRTGARPRRRRAAGARSGGPGPCRSPARRWRRAGRGSPRPRRPRRCRRDGRA